jgi:hypothetical protein
MWLRDSYITTEINFGGIERQIAPIPTFCKLRFCPKKIAKAKKRAREVIVTLLLVQYRLNLHAQARPPPHFQAANWWRDAGKTPCERAALKWGKTMATRPERKKMVRALPTARLPKFSPLYLYSG